MPQHFQDIFRVKVNSNYAFMFYISYFKFFLENIVSKYFIIISQKYLCAIIINKES